MKEIIKMIVVLSLICGIAGAALSYLKMSTAPMIEEQVLTYVQGPRIKDVFPASDNDPIADRKKFEVDGAQVTVFPIIQGGELTNVAIEAFGAGGYGGDVGVMVGFNLSDDTLAGIGITTMKETPGLGSRIAEPAYTEQFTGKGYELELSDVDAVSGATKSTTASVNAVNNAGKLYTALKPEFAKAWN